MIDGGLGRLEDTPLGPRAPSPPREGETGPDQEHRAGGGNTSNRLSGNAEHLSGVREAREAAEATAGSLRRECLVADDLAAGSIHGQRRSELRLPAVAAIDREDEWRATGLR